MEIFISSSSGSRKWADKLEEDLSHQGLTVWHPKNLVPGTNWQHEIERAIKKADAIVVLVEPRREPDDTQRFEWKTTLEAVWQDSEKQLIPLLLKDAEIPSFVRSRSAIRIDNPRYDWDRAVQQLVQVIKEENDFGEQSSIDETSDSNELQDRLSYITGVAESLKSSRER